MNVSFFWRCWRSSVPFPLPFASAFAVISRLFPFVVAAFCSLAFSSAHAATVSAEASPPDARPNQQFAYSITVENGNVEQVPNLRLPLQIGMASAAQQSNEISIINGRQTIRTRFTWALVASEPGDFVIASQTVKVDGQDVNTNEVKLRIKEGAPPPEQQGTDPLLQISVDKTEFYQGEVVPIKAMLYVHRNTQLRRLGLVEMAKSDFAIQRFPQQSEQSLEMIGGQPYYVLTFRSTLSALKTGKLTLGPASMEVIIEVPTRMSSGFPGGGFLAMPGEPRKVAVRSPEVGLTVLALPADGKPANFSGAVGDFTLNASASPTSLAVGEPVTVELQIAGTGNFDALTAPSLTDPSGWKTYPTRRYNTSGQPDPNGLLGIERQIGFTQVLVPEKELPAVPPFEMSFFSPSQKKYVTLRTQPVPLAVKAGAASTVGADAGVASSSGPAGQGAAARVRTPEPDITDILLHLPAAPQWISAATVPLPQRPVFWIVNAVPFAVFLALAFFTWDKRRRERYARSPASALRALWQQLNESGLDEAEFYRRAARFIHATVDGSAPSAGVGAVLQRYQSLNFSGAGASGTSPLSASQRSEVLGTLAPLLAKTKSVQPAAGVLRPAAASTVISGMLLICAAASGGARAASPEDRYRDITGALAGKDYNRAQAGAEALLGDGLLSPELFEIMGHTRYRQGDHGRAVLWYERASLFTPRVPEIRQNLRHLDDKTRFLTFSDGSPLHAYGLLLQRDTWVLIASSGLWLLLLGAGVAIAATNGRLRGWCIAAVVLGVLLLPAGIAGAAWRPMGVDRVKNIFIVTSPSSKAYTAASTTSGTVIDLPPGSQIRLLEKRGAWSYVEIPNPSDNLRGWMEQDALTALWPVGWPVSVIP